MHTGFRGVYSRLNMRAILMRIAFHHNPLLSLLVLQWSNAAYDVFIPCVQELVTMSVLRAPRATVNLEELKHYDASFPGLCPSVTEEG